MTCKYASHRVRERKTATAHLQTPSDCNIHYEELHCKTSGNVYGNILTT